MFEGPEHHAGNFIARMRPDVDDLVVTLAVRDDALAILLLDLPDLFVSIFQLGLLLFRNNHVRNSDRDSGFRCFSKAELLQLIQSGNRGGRSGDLITAPDNVAKLFLAGRLVEEPKFLRPNLVKNDTASRGFDRLGLR